jgi:hypothetical protein
VVDDYHLTGGGSQPDQDPKRIGLADMLRALRYELLEAQSNVAGSGEPPLLNLEGAEVEVKFTVSKGASGKLGANVHFFAVEVGGKYDLEEVHRLTLKLEPAVKADGTKRGVSVAEKHD